MICWPGRLQTAVPRRDPLTFDAILQQPGRFKKQMDSGSVRSGSTASIGGFFEAGERVRLLFWVSPHTSSMCESAAGTAGLVVASSALSKSTLRPSAELLGRSAHRGGFLDGTIPQT